MYLDSGDVTLTVDPIRRDQWDYDGYNKFEKSVKRGEELDAIAFKDSLGWERATGPGIEFFVPTSGMLDSMLKFPNPPPDKGCPGFSSGRRGKLPAILQRLYDGSLINKSPGDIEHEMREADRRRSDRVFDTSGWVR